MADAQQIVDELVKLFGTSEDDLLRLIRHDREWAAVRSRRCEEAERGLDALTMAVATMAIKYGAQGAGPSPIQWVEEVCRRLDALREAAAQDVREKERLLAELDAARLVVKAAEALSETHAELVALQKRHFDERNHYRDLALGRPDANDRVLALSEALAKSQRNHAELKDERLANEAPGALGGWWVPVEVPDDGMLPVPRLELAFAQIDGWAVYEVVYRLVYREIGGVLVGHPLSRCRKSGAPPRPPAADDLPWRFIPEASHDAWHLGLPIYIVRPDMPPREQRPAAEQRARGVEHRRPWPGPAGR